MESLVAPIVSISRGLLDREKLLVSHYIGGAIILLGVYLINKPFQQATPTTLDPEEVSVAS
jgi:drug/metabolite transporter (DMT)-like permease